MRPNTQELHISLRKELFFNVPANTSHNGETEPKKNTSHKARTGTVWLMGQLLPFQHHRLHRCRQSHRCAPACHPARKRPAKPKTELISRSRPTVRLTSTKGWGSVEKPVWALFFFPVLVHKLSWAKAPPCGQLSALPEHFQIPVEYLSVQRVGCWVHFMF